MTIHNITILSPRITVLPDGRLDVKNAALYLGFKDKTLAIMRGNGSGPKFIKRGRVFYYKEDLDDWINQGGRFSSTTQLQRSKIQNQKEK